jgi:small subunit ribosomal protein S6
MNTSKRQYRATFILDNRGKEDSTDSMIEGLKKEIAAIQGDVTAVDLVGKKDFVRVTDRKFTGAIYVQVTFSAPPDGPAHLKERLRLNHNVYRTFVESR